MWDTVCAPCVSHHFHSGLHYPRSSLASQFSSLSACFSQDKQPFTSSDLCTRPFQLFSHFQLL